MSLTVWNVWKDFIWKTHFLVSEMKKSKIVYYMIELHTLHHVFYAIKTIFYNIIHALLDWGQLVSVIFKWIQKINVFSVKMDIKLQEIN